MLNVISKISTIKVQLFCIFLSVQQHKALYDVFRKHVAYC